MSKFSVGDVVRQTSTFLRSIGMYKGVPVNGVVVDFVKGLNFPVVFWSNSSVSPINPANLEIHKAGQAQMTPGLRASVVAEGKALYAAKLAKEAAEEAAYCASPEGQAAKAKIGAGVLRSSLRSNPKKGRKTSFKRNPGFSLTDAKALLDKQLTASLGKGWGTFSGETRQMPSGAWRIGVLYPKTGRWYWTIWSTGRLKGEHSLGGSRDPKKWTSGHARKNPRKPGSLTAKGSEALLREAKKADRLGDSVARELGEHHAATQAYRTEAEGYRRRAALREKLGKGLRKNPGVKLPAMGETLHLSAHGKTLGVKKVRAGSYTAGIEGTRMYVGGPSGKRWGNAPVRRK